jgi:hypothetical protein
LETYVIYIAGYIALKLTKIYFSKKALKNKDFYGFTFVVDSKSNNIVRLCLEFLSATQTL